MGWSVYEKVIQSTKSKIIKIRLRKLRLQINIFAKPKAFRALNISKGFFVM